MDAFTNYTSKIAALTFISEALSQQEVYNFNIESSVEDIDGYKGTGNIEFWPNN